MAWLPVVAKLVAGGGGGVQIRQSVPLARVSAIPRRATGRASIGGERCGASGDRRYEVAGMCRSRAVFRLCGGANQYRLSDECGRVDYRQSHASTGQSRSILCCRDEDWFDAHLRCVVHYTRPGCQLVNGDFTSAENLVTSSLPPLGIRIVMESFRSISTPPVHSNSGNEQPC